MELLAPIKLIEEAMRLSDQHVQGKYPKDTPYIYTPKGDAVVFIRKVGFDVEP